MKPENVCPSCNGTGYVRTRTIQNPFKNCSVCKGLEYKNESEE